MCQALASNGNDVELIIPRKDKIYSDPFLYYGIKPNLFKISRVLWLPIKGKGYLYSLFSAVKVRFTNPEIVYSRNLVAAWVAAFLGCKVIFESHFPVSSSGFISKRIFNSLINKNKLIKLVVITHALKKYYEEDSPSLRKKIQVLPDAAYAYDEQCSPLPLQGNVDNVNVGYVGSLHKGKGLEIISKLAIICSYANFHVVGGEASQVKYYTKKFSNIPNLFFYGHVEHHKTKSYIKAFDVVLLPNQQEVKTSGRGVNIGKWTSPLKAFEYMAEKKPIIASDLPVLREILIHESNALLCSATDILQWREALDKLRNDSHLSRSLAEKAYNDFLNNYTWTARAKKAVHDVGGNNE
ncbi:glycosyltransferase [Halomonas sp. MCCC 1A11062]|nr:glycosyltransferase [Halomonas sp. MCCC 1A11062]